MVSELRVVIATAGRPDLLQRTLNSFAACNKPPVYQGIVVAENGAAEGVEQIIQEAPADLKAHYVYDPQPNKSHALNLALDNLPDHCLAIFTDDDVRVEPDFLDRYAAAAKGVESGKFFGGPMAAEYEEEPKPYVRPYLPGSARGWSPNPATEAADLLFLGCNWGGFVGDLRRAGLFDVRLGPGGTTDAVAQDWQMQQNLHQIGVHGAIVPDSMVYHWVPRDRCSPTWTCNRGFRNGIRRGNLLRDARGIRKLKRFVRCLAPTSAGTLGYVATRFCWSPRARFWAEYNHQVTRGILRGLASERP